MAGSHPEPAFSNWFIVRKEKTMDFLQLSHDRYSVRKFKDTPVEQEKIDKIIEAAMTAPTACNWQPF